MENHLQHSLDAADWGAREAWRFKLNADQDRMNWAIGYAEAAAFYALYYD